MFSRWPVFNTGAMFPFFEFPFYLLVEVSVAFTAVCLIGVSCKCFSSFISSCSSFTFCLRLSLFSMFGIHNFLEGIFRCLLCRLVELSERIFRSFPVCFGCCCGRFCQFYLFHLQVKCQLVISRHRLFYLGLYFFRFYLSL